MEFPKLTFENYTEKIVPEGCFQVDESVVSVVCCFQVDVCVWSVSSVVAGCSQLLASERLAAWHECSALSPTES